MNAQEGTNHLSGEQKIGFVLLLVFSILVVGLGMLQLRNTVYGPFIARRAALPSNDQALVVDEDTRLQQVDTDQDGLKDYDELNFYQTSPYLPDTDSDGIKDKEEIDRGTDPNCAPGADCDVAEETPDQGTQVLESPLNPLGGNTQLDGFAQAMGGESIDPNVFLAALNDPQALRQLLLQTGQITDAQLANITDEQLLALAQEVYGQMQQATTTQP